MFDIKTSFCCLSCTSLWCWLRCIAVLQVLVTCSWLQACGLYCYVTGADPLSISCIADQSGSFCKPAPPLQIHGSGVCSLEWTCMFPVQFAMFL